MSGWGKAAGVGLEMYAAGLKAKAAYQADKENSEIRQQERRIAFNRETEALLANRELIKQQATADNMNISMAAQRANDELSVAMAGSGIGGQSVSELSADINRQIASDRIAVQRASQGQLDSMNQSYLQSTENKLIEARQTKVHDHNQMIMNAMFSSVGRSLGA